MKGLDVIYLRFSLIVLTAATVLLCLLWLPGVADLAAKVNPEVAFLKYPVLLGILATALAFLWALFQAWQLLRLPARQAFFSPDALVRAKQIRYAGVFIALSYVAGIFYLAMNHALPPGLALTGAAIAFLSLGASAFATWLAR